MLDRFIQDVKTYNIMIRDENYKARLMEAYNCLKQEGIRSAKELENHKELLDSTFTYNDITIFDRIADPEYTKKLIKAYDTIAYQVEKELPEEETERQFGR